MAFLQYNLDILLPYLLYIRTQIQELIYHFVKSRNYSYKTNYTNKYGINHTIIKEKATSNSVAVSFTTIEKTNKFCAGDGINTAFVTCIGY